MSLIAALPDDEWTYLPELQGKHTNLLVGVSLHEGEVVALAQWTEYETENGAPRPKGCEARAEGRAEPSGAGTGEARRIKLDWYCLGWNTDGAGRILTMSSMAVKEGRA